MTRRFLIGVLAAVALTAALPAAASGAQIAHDGSVLTYSAAAGESNSVMLFVNEHAIHCDPLPAPCFSVTDAVRITSFPSSRCRLASSGAFGDEVLCTMPERVVANLGDRDDALYDWDGRTTVDAGAGNDNPIYGKGGDDVLNGEAGSDNLMGGDGDDVLNGGPGDDYFEGLSFEPPHSHGDDTYVGGGGSDRLNYESRTEDLVLSPDGVARDGAAGENDDIGADVMTIVGGGGHDRLIGNAGRNVFFGGPGDDELLGGAGDDHLQSGVGNDRIDGGPGQDVLGGEDGDDRLEGGPDVDRFWGDAIGACIPSSCSAGQDVIFARDGNVEELNCGPGTDAAQVDPVERVYGSGTDQCEAIDGLAPPAPAGGGTGAPAGAPPTTPGSPAAGAGFLQDSQLLADRRGRVALPLKAPAAGVFSVELRARVRAGAGKASASARRPVRIARATAVARRAGRVVVRLRLSAAARRTLARSRRLAASVRVRFNPVEGETSEQRRRVTLRR